MESEFRFQWGSQNLEPKIGIPNQGWRGGMALLLSMVVTKAEEEEEEEDLPREGAAAPLPLPPLSSSGQLLQSIWCCP